MIPHLNGPVALLWTTSREGRGDIVSLADALHFCSRARRHGRCTPSSKVILNDLWANIVKQVVALMHIYIFDVHGALHDLNAPPRLLRSESNRMRAHMDADTAWGVLERARVIYSATPELVVAVRNDGPSLAGVHPTTGGRYLAQVTGPYDPERPSMPLLGEVSQFANQNQWLAKGGRPKETPSISRVPHRPTRSWRRPPRSDLSHAVCSESEACEGHA